MYHVKFITYEADGKILYIVISLPHVELLVYC